MVITMHLSLPLIARPRAPRLPRTDGAVAALRAVAVPGSVRGGAPALHARVAQERLAALGLLEAEAVTGRWDRRTLDAVARFQAAHALPVDGQLDARTADALIAAA
jgi:peptidoglycan hydrolase-like protein with peptidoglycan-binding domain